MLSLVTVVIGQNLSQTSNFQVSYRLTFQFCRQRYLWITASHLPGHLNVVADHHSRVFDDKTEWKLNPLVFQRIVQQFIKPDIDLFASRLNFQLKPFVSWRPDPLAKCIDAFTFDWAYEVFFAVGSLGCNDS